MGKLLSIGAAAKALGVSTSTLRRWEGAGRLVPIRTEDGQRRYDLAALRPGLTHSATVPRRTVAYARVSSHNQRADLEHQKQVLESYCAAQGWPFDIIAVFAARLYGSRSHRNQKLIDGVRRAVQEAQC